MSRINALMIAGMVPAAATLITLAPQMGLGVAAGAPGPAFSLESTVMLDDGSDTCATDIHVFHDAGDSLLFCYTLTNTGSEALSMHDVSESHSGQIAGPGDPTVVEPGESMSVTTTFVMMVTGFHEVTWSATGVDSGIEVSQTDYAYHTVEGTDVRLDMTMMVDDGNDTCGTETALAVPSGTNVRLCYTMTNTVDEPLDSHFLLDEHLGTLLAYVGPEIDSGESLVVTAVTTIDAPALWMATWDAHGVDTDVVYGGVDSVMIELVDPAATTTTTTVSCVATTPPVVTEPPTTTQPPTTMPPTTTEPTTTTTTSTTSTSTTTTTTPSFTTTTSTTSPVLALPTTTTSGEPAGFARAGYAGEHRGLVRQVPVAVPCPETPPGGGQPPGGSLPATGSQVWVLVVLAAGSLVMGVASLHVGRRSRR